MQRGLGNWQNFTLGITPFLHNLSRLGPPLGGNIGAGQSRSSRHFSHTQETQESHFCSLFPAKLFIDLVWL